MSGEEDISRSLQKIFTKHYATLRRILPVEELIPEFVSCGAITYDDEEEILSHPTSSERARLFLSHVRKALGAGISRSFFKLLGIMQLSRKHDCKELGESISEEIRRELHVDVTTQEASG